MPIYEIKPRIEGNPIFLAKADNEEDARISASASANSTASYLLPKRVVMGECPIMNDFYLYQDNAVCNQLIEGEDYELLSDNPQLTTIAIADKKYYLKNLLAVVR